MQVEPSSGTAAGLALLSTIEVSGSLQAGRLVTPGDGLGESGLGVSKTPGAHMLRRRRRLLLEDLLSLSVLSPHAVVGLAGSAWAVGAARQVSEGRWERVLLRSLRSTCISYELLLVVPGV